MTPPTLLAIVATLALIVVTLGDLGWCWLVPFGPCRRCTGTGSLRNPILRRTFRDCPRCDGTGRRVRLGRRVVEYLRAEYERGTR